MNRQLYQYNQDFGFTFIPGLKARIEHESGGYLVQVNQAGFRCQHEFIKKKPSGKFRIIVLGDSFTAGDSVSNKNRYTDILETMLPDTEVYNFGLSGTGTDQQYLIFHHLASKMEYDLVIFSVQVENIRRIASHYRPYVSNTGKTLLMPKPYFSLTGEGRLQLHHFPVPKNPVSPEELPEKQWEYVDQGGNLHVLRKIVNRLGGKVKNLAQKISRYHPVPAYNDPDHPDWLLMKAILQQCLSEISSKTIIFPIPLYQFLEETCDIGSYQQRFAELESLPNVYVHDPLPFLLTYSKLERRNFRFKVDVHPTPAYHHALAKSLALRIQELRT